ncbi:hypothetical protein [Winogradskya humida]|uniref:Uncharacterized protein n=1 Tax=Winogradskya humida TaxID=113566 RepID=A0ABQ3ZEV7_9ACTN|nr:hypothetical protein [Actinoplanes humidus]GIE17113.1 hypothetical protein Ahu01nite_002150 [Actinoplanes humidus]
MAKDVREGGFLWNWIYKYWAGPASVQGAIEGVTQEARDGWKADLEERKRYSRAQRARKQAAKRG